VSLPFLVVLNQQVNRNVCGATPKAVVCTPDVPGRGFPMCAAMRPKEGFWAIGLAF